MLMHYTGISVCVQLAPQPLIVVWHSRKVLDPEIFVLLNYKNLNRRNS